jgi:hypothetical protein
VKGREVERFDVFSAGQVIGKHLLCGCDGVAFKQGDFFGAGLWCGTAAVKQIDHA